MNDSPIVRKVLREVKEMPPLPDVVVKVMRITRDPEATAQDLTKVISQDQALTGNLLRLCNSAYYGLPRTISSLTQAVMYLGFHTVRNLVLTCSVGNLFGPDTKIYGYEQNGLWKHSIAAAMIGEMIGKAIRPETKDVAYTGGLLHDIGQLLLATTIEDTADTIAEMIENGEATELEAERSALGITHAETGALLADHWNFPDELTGAIRHHHEPGNAVPPSKLACVVHLADATALQLGYGVALENMKYGPDPAALAVLGIGEKDVNGLRAMAGERIEEHAEQFLIAMR